MNRRSLLANILGDWRGGHVIVVLLESKQTMRTNREKHDSERARARVLRHLLYNVCAYLCRIYGDRRERTHTARLSWRARPNICSSRGGCGWAVLGGSIAIALSLRLCDYLV